MRSCSYVRHCACNQHGTFTSKGGVVCRLLCPRGKRNKKKKNCLYILYIFFPVLYPAPLLYKNELSSDARKRISWPSGNGVRSVITRIRVLYGFSLSLSLFTILEYKPQRQLVTTTLQTIEHATENPEYLFTYFIRYLFLHKFVPDKCPRLFSINDEKRAKTTWPFDY